jgi:hypothetical protein
MILSWLWRCACGDVGEGALQNTFATQCAPSVCCWVLFEWFKFHLYANFTQGAWGSTMPLLQMFEMNLLHINFWTHFCYLSVMTDGFLKFYEIILLTAFYFP